MRVPLHVREDGGPCCMLCGRVPSTPELEAENRDDGGSDELQPYVFNFDGPGGVGSLIYVGWVCAGRVHGDLPNSADEGRRLGRYSQPAVAAR